MQIIRQRERITYIKYFLTFTLYTSDSEFKGCSISVDCDKDGKVDLEELKLRKPIAYQSYLEHLSGKVWKLKGVKYTPDYSDPERNYVPILCTGTWVEYEVWSPVVVESDCSYVEPAHGMCQCGCEVVLYGFTNTCHGCERDYNGSGQLLATREQWGEETGESLSDILSIP